MDGVDTADMRQSAWDCSTPSTLSTTTNTLFSGGPSASKPESIDAT
jgi:hypothetical protein